MEGILKQSLIIVAVKVRPDIKALKIHRRFMCKLVTSLPWFVVIWVNCAFNSPWTESRHTFFVRIRYFVNERFAQNPLIGQEASLVWV